MLQSSLLLIAFRIFLHFLHLFSLSFRMKDEIGTEGSMEEEEGDLGDDLRDLDEEVSLSN